LREASSVWRFDSVKFFTQPETPADLEEKEENKGKQRREAMLAVNPTPSFRE
jgi:hypothetical protein